MKFLSRSMSALAVLIIGLGAVAPKTLVAQSEKQAAVVISIAPINEQLKDASYLSDAAGFGRLGGMIINSQADEYLGGVDRDKPINLFVHIDKDKPEEPVVVGMLPVTDFDEVIDTLAELGDVDDDKEIVEISMDNGETIYVVEQKGHAVFSNSKEGLEWLPSNPAKEVGDLHKKYNFAARIFGQRIPKKLRDQAVEAMREGFERQLEEQGTDESELHKKSVELQMQQMESLINETKEVVIGFTADKAKNVLNFDLKMVGLKGSKMAKTANAQKELKESRFRGFVQDGAMITMNFNSKMTKDEVESYKSILTGLRKQMADELDLGDLSDDEADAVEKVLESLLSTAEKTMTKDGITNGGMVLTGNKKPTMALGFHAASTSDLESSLKNLAKVAEDSRGIKVKLNAGKIGNTTLHEAAIPIPEGESEARAMFGEELKLVVGINGNTVYLAAGNEPESLLGKCMKSSSKKVKPFEMNFHLANIMEMFAEMEAEQMVEEMADILKESGKDRISIWSTTVENGIKARLEIQDGILKLISVAAEQFGGGFGF